MNKRGVPSHAKNVLKYIQTITYALIDLLIWQQDFVFIFSYMVFKFNLNLLIYCFSDQLKCQLIPEATSLDSMPGFSEEKKPKDGSVVVDTTELIDTFLSDHSLLDKIAENINKSIEAQREIDIAQQEGKILDPPTLEKAIDCTQSDPQIKNVLDEFLSKF